MSQASRAIEEDAGDCEDREDGEQSFGEWKPTVRDEVVVEVSECEDDSDDESGADSDEGENEWGVLDSSEEEDASDDGDASDASSISSAEAESEEVESKKREVARGFWGDTEGEYERICDRLKELEAR